jgi:asparagine synthase (glutamine-hydrolysing)
VEYAFNLPGRLKMKGSLGKVILLNTFRDILPDSLLRRPKMGFEMPINTWLRDELRFLVEDYLNEEAIKRQGVFRPAKVSELVKIHMGGYQDKSWHLWNLIVFGHWYRTWMGI